MDKFITRGISKETGEFVFGYYFYHEYFKRHYIIYIEMEQVDGYQEPPCPVEHRVEIIQEPDMWIGDLADNGDKIWQKDRVEYKSWQHIGKANIEDCIKEYIAEEVRYTNSTKTDVLCEQKVIGNTHNIDK